MDTLFACAEPAFESSRAPFVASADKNAARASLSSSSMSASTSSSSAPAAAAAESNRSSSQPAPPYEVNMETNDTSVAHVYSLHGWSSEQCASSKFRRALDFFQRGRACPWIACNRSDAPEFFVPSTPGTATAYPYARGSKVYDLLRSTDQAIAKAFVESRMKCSCTMCTEVRNSKMRTLMRSKCAYRERVIHTKFPSMVSQCQTTAVRPCEVVLAAEMTAGEFAALSMLAADTREATRRGSAPYPTVEEWMRSPLASTLTDPDETLTFINALSARYASELHNGSESRADDVTQMTHAFVDAMDAFDAHVNSVLDATLTAWAETKKRVLHTSIGASLLTRATEAEKSTIQEAANSAKVPHRVPAWSSVGYQREFMRARALLTFSKVDKKGEAVDYVDLSLKEEIVARQAAAPALMALRALTSEAARATRTVVDLMCRGAGAALSTPELEAGVSVLTPVVHFLDAMVDTRLANKRIMRTYFDAMRDCKALNTVSGVDLLPLDDAFVREGAQWIAFSTLTAVNAAEKAALRKRAVDQHMAKVGLRSTRPGYALSPDGVSARDYSAVKPNVVYSGTMMEALYVATRATQTATGVVPIDRAARAHDAVTFDFTIERIVHQMKIPDITRLVGFSQLDWDFLQAAVVYEERESEADSEFAQPYTGPNGETRVRHMGLSMKVFYFLKMELIRAQIDQTRAALLHIRERLMQRNAMRDFRFSHQARASKHVAVCEFKHQILDDKKVSVSFWSPPPDTANRCLFCKAKQVEFASQFPITSVRPTTCACACHSASAAAAAAAAAASSSASQATIKDYEFLYSVHDDRHVATTFQTRIPSGQKDAALASYDAISYSHKQTTMQGGLLSDYLPLAEFMDKFTSFNSLRDIDMLLYVYLPARLDACLTEATKRIGSDLFKSLSFQFREFRRAHGLEYRSLRDTFALGTLTPVTVCLPRASDVPFKMPDDETAKPAADATGERVVLTAERTLPLTREEDSECSICFASMRGMGKRRPGRTCACRELICDACQRSEQLPAVCLICREDFSKNVPDLANRKRRK